MSVHCGVNASSQFSHWFFVVAIRRAEVHALGMDFLRGLQQLNVSNDGIDRIPSSDGERA